MLTELMAGNGIGKHTKQYRYTDKNGDRVYPKFDDTVFVGCIFDVFDEIGNHMI